MFISFCGAQATITATPYRKVDAKVPRWGGLQGEYLDKTNKHK
jgi:hypothetical protein